MDFSKALSLLKKGKKIYRNGWNGKGLHIEQQVPDENSKMTRSYMYIVMPKGSTNQLGASSLDVDRVPWVPSQTDLVAEDWAFIPE